MNSLAKKMTYFSEGTMKTIFLFGLLLTTLLSVNAFALDLDGAQKRGLVGEQPNGYIGVVKNTAETKALVQQINKKREEAYREIAIEHQITLEKVAAMAGVKLIKKTQPGEYYRSSDGQWKKK